MKAANILETIGNTPHIRINRLFGSEAEVWIKSERSNPAASIKDRIALSMVEDAERSGKLKSGGNQTAAQAVGKAIAERAIAAGIKAVCFDRGAYRYHGRVAALANAAREGGLSF